MYLVVTNIPETFRTPDLRNYFSLFIEKGAFNCFHFRHRPCEQLREILLSSNQNPSHSQNESETDTQSVSNDVNKKDNTQEKGENMTVDETDTIHANDRPKTAHWLSSGLSGLSSLISEKKKKAQESKSGFEKVGTDKPLKSGSTGKTVKESPSHSPGENLCIISGVLQVLECAKGTCCVIDVKDSETEDFMEFYNNKHFVDRDGNVHQSKCFIHKLDVNKNIQKGMLY